MLPSDNPTPEDRDQDAPIPVSSPPEKSSEEGLNPTMSEEFHVVDSRDLLRGERGLIITHGNDHYRLLVTRNDKLILQK